eukprot:CAMPEP_0177680358 /NCGR_PEP_ID=MMETSP0447-20121125/30128_1 /TAXON_ID=0 /ORGANISM="Stygamoeba regulata, Strain BSH-02190019" /LENGTH=44 /DNA_ID= /DNA_START= /DNA_END= /DNA_ORIENTATION=
MGDGRVFQQLIDCGRHMTACQLQLVSLKGGLGQCRALMKALQTD